MGATGVLSRQASPVTFWQSTNGKKVVMAVTGVILFAFVLGHMLGNLQISKALTHQCLRAFPAQPREMLWIGAASVCWSQSRLHIRSAIRLALRNNAARPVAYATRKEAINSSYASRTMYWSGPIVTRLHHLPPASVHRRYRSSWRRIHRRRRLPQRRRRLLRLVGFGLVHLRHDSAWPSSAPRRVEHVPIRRLQSSAPHAHPENAALVVAIVIIVRITFPSPSACSPGFINQ